MPSSSSWEYLRLGWGCLGDQQALDPLHQHIHLLLELHWRKLELPWIYLTEASTCKRIPRTAACSPNSIHVQIFGNRSQFSGIRLSAASHLDPDFAVVLITGQNCASREEVPPWSTVLILLGKQAAGTTTCSLRVEFCPQTPQKKWAAFLLL